MSHSSPPPPAPELLLKAVARLIRPLLRLLMRSGVTFPVLTDMLRAEFVSVAVNDLLPDPAARTDSRISLLTGLQRREVRRLRALEGAADDTPLVVTLGSQIVARWLGTQHLTDAGGRPLPLPRAAQPDGAPSFEELVRSVTTDMRPRAVLDEWLGRGLVTLDAQNRVTLLETAFLPRQGGEEQLFYFARNLHDHVAAASANVASSGRVPFLDRSVHYDRLQLDAAARLEAKARDAALAMLIEVNRSAIELADADDAAGQPTRRVNLGVYLYTEDEPTAEDTP